MPTPSKVKYRLRPLPHSITLHQTARDGYGNLTEQSSTVDAYIEVAPAVKPIADGLVRTTQGFAMVLGTTSVSIGDHVTVSGVKRLILDINEVRGLGSAILHKELIF